MNNLRRISILVLMLLATYSTQKADLENNMQTFDTHALLLYFTISINPLKGKEMKKFLDKVNLVENRLLKWADTNSHSFLRVIIGMIYILYGGLKFFPNHSPAEQLAVNTIEKLSFGLLSGTPAQVSLAIIETMLGLCLVFRYRLRWTVYAAIGHMIGTFLPVFFFPEVVFTSAPLSFSLVGQYILKNLIIVGALFVLYSKTVNKQSKIIYIHSSGDRKGFSGFTHDKPFKEQSSLVENRKVSSR